jgi:uncharacterized radical SAM superfamily protein
MAKLSARAIWELTEQDLLTLIYSKQLVLRKKIRFYAPSFTSYNSRRFSSSNKEFVTISVTGNSCALKCKHCGGRVLETMLEAKTPQILFNLVSNLKENGAFGCLISGGCLADGAVPLKEFIPEIARIKKKLGITVFVHTGILDLETALSLKDAQVDAVLIDILGSNETIREIYNLKTSTKEYESSLKSLQFARLNFIPHIVSGLHNGKLKGEFHALKMIKPYNPSAIVVISFMPIRGTAMAKTKPPRPTEIARVTAVARVMFPQIPLVLGCMRPKGRRRSETDLLSIKTGIDAIAFPEEDAITYAEKHGYLVTYSHFCCAQIYKDILKQ